MSNKIKYISYLDNNQIVSCDFDNILRIWDATTGNLIKEISDIKDYLINSLDLFSDKKICAFNNSSVKFFDLNTCNWMNKSINLNIESVRLNKCMVSSAKIVLGYNGTIEIHDIENDVMVKGWEDNFEIIHSSPDGSQFAISSYINGLIKIYDSNSYELITSINDTDIIINFMYSPVDDFIVSINWSNVIEIWNCRTGLSQKNYELLL
ncbi:wd-repeat family protein [Moumouvirus maliensis]|nr:wd-repeat family protein [Moumouvirus maliensis]